MERLTRPTVKVDETAAKYMVADGCIPTDLRSMNDRLLDLVLNGPTLNGVNKDTLRQLIRQLYATLKPYEDTGLGPDEAKAIKAYADRKAVAMVTEINGVSIERVLELTEADQEGRLVVLPCVAETDIVRDGETFHGDHWSHILTAFRDDPTACSGMRVALIDIEEAEMALEGGNGGG